MGTLSWLPFHQLTTVRKLALWKRTLHNVYHPIMTRDLKRRKLVRSLDLLIYRKKCLLEKYLRSKLRCRSRNQKNLRRVAMKLEIIRRAVKRNIEINCLHALYLVSLFVKLVILLAWKCIKKGRMLGTKILNDTPIWIIHLSPL